MAKESVDKGTELEKLEQDQAVQDEIFNDAFETAANLDGKPSETEDKSIEDNAGTSGEGINKEDKTTVIATDADKGTAGTAATEDKSTVAKKDSEETYEQRYKTLQGIVEANQKKYDAEKAQLAADLKALQDKIAELSKGKTDATTKSDEDDLSPDLKKAIEEYEKDFDVVSKMEGVKRDRELKKLEKRIMDSLKVEYDKKIQEISERFETKVKPLEESLQINDQEAHFAYIKEKHSDFETYRDDGSILKWIDSKPKYLQGYLKEVYNKGTAEQIVELLTDFKHENNLSTESDNNKASNVTDIEEERKKQEKLKKKQGLTAVVTKHSAVNASQASADDFDSAFDEAANKAK